MASEVLKRLRDQRGNVWNEASALATQAADENRSFSAEEQGKWDAYNDELDQLDKRMKSLMETEQRAKDADDAFDRLSGKPRETQTAGAGAGGRGMRSDEIRAWARGEAGTPKAIDLPVSQVRRYLEPGPIVLVTSALGDARNIMTMGWHTVMEFTPSLLHW